MTCDAFSDGLRPEVQMARYISDDDLQRLTAQLLFKALIGEKTEHKALFPGSKLYRITDEQIPDYLLFEQTIGDDKRARGQHLYYLYRREGKGSHEEREPLWRMVIDYRWDAIKMIQDSIDEQDARTFLNQCLVDGHAKGNIIHLPERQDPSSRDGLFFYDDVDGNLRAFNGQRYITTRAQQRRNILSDPLYLAEIQGGTLF